MLPSDADRCCQQADTAVTISIDNANSNQIYANDLSSVGAAAMRVTNAQSNIITQNYPAATCGHGIEVGENTADNTIALCHFQNLPGHGVYESSANGARNTYADVSGATLLSARSRSDLLS